MEGQVRTASPEGYAAPYVVDRQELAELREPFLDGLKDVNSRRKKAQPLSTKNQGLASPVRDSLKVKDSSLGALKRGFADGKQWAAEMMTGPAEFVPMKTLVKVGVAGLAGLSVASAPLMPLDLLMFSTPILNYLGPLHASQSFFSQFGLSCMLGLAVGSCPPAYLPLAIRTLTSAFGLFALWQERRQETIMGGSACSSVTFSQSALAFGGTLALGQSILWAVTQSVPVMLIAGAAIGLALGAGRDQLRQNASDRVLASIPMSRFIS